MSVENKKTNKKFSLIKWFLKMPLKNRIQISIASALTVLLIIAIPTYSWFSRQRELARLERINSPNTLFITAAHREDTIYLKVGGIDVEGYWDKAENDPMEHRYYVFSVAGKYVTDYTLQLAHTTNNNYTYKIYQADFSKTKPNGIDGKDYVSYIVKDEYPDTDAFPSIANRKDKAGNEVTISRNDVLYYTIRQDGSNPKKNICLNAGVTYLIGGVSKTFDGHYLNKQSDYLANTTYHTDTYDSYAIAKVDAHAEPLYWQATGIEVEDSSNRDPFYHEYILEVSWDRNLASSTYKDTDIIYITAGIEQ